MWWGQSFGKNTSNLIKGKDELDYDVMIDYLVANKMVVNLNMFITGMKHQIRG